MLGPTLAELQPAAEGLAPALEAFQSFAKETKPAIEDQIGPFTVTAQPTAAALRPAAADLADVQPELADSFEVLNQLFNGLAYNPPGKQEGYLYWLAWANHMAASMLSSQDAQRPDAPRRAPRVLRLAAGVRGGRQGERDPRHARHAAQRAVVPVGLRRARPPPPARRARRRSCKQGAAQGDPIQAATLKVLGEKPAAVTARRRPPRAGLRHRRRAGRGGRTCRKSPQASVGSS